MIERVARLFVWRSSVVIAPDAASSHAEPEVVTGAGLPPRVQVRSVDAGHLDWREELGRRREPGAVDDHADLVHEVVAAADPLGSTSTTGSITMSTLGWATVVYQSLENSTCLG